MLAKYLFQSFFLFSTLSYIKADDYYKAIEGTYYKPCQNDEFFSFSQTLEVKEEDWIFTSHLYQWADCKGGKVMTTIKRSKIAHIDEENLDLIIGRSTISFESNHQLKEANKNKFYGKSDWKLSQPFQINGLNGEPKLGVIIYSTYLKTSKELIYSKPSLEGLDGKLESHRSMDLNTRYLVLNKIKR